MPSGKARFVILVLDLVERDKFDGASEAKRIGIFCTALIRP